MHKFDTRQISLMALFTAFAVILSYVETFIPSIGIPGVKLGLANFAIIFTMYFLGYGQAILVNVVRIIIVGVFFGSMFSISFSIAGALVGFAIMALLKRTGKVSMVTVSIAGGVFHNVGQLIVACFVVDTYSVFTYLPVLIVAGIITGLIIGVLSRIVYGRTKGLFENMLKR